MARPHPAVGIDLGTTNSTVAFVDPTGRPETIRNAEGGLSTPSAVFFDRGSPVIGAEAMEAGFEEPDRLALFAKRDVGEQAFRKSICGASFPPEVLQALVLRKLKEDAELKLGAIEKAVITVPAFFNEPCRKSTQDAGRLAGLDVLDIINEPTAAAICFGVQQGFLTPEGESQQEERVLVYDLGGGTFDVTVMELKDRNYQTIATNGDVYLGGVDWDRRIVDFIAEAWLDEYGEDIREDPIAEQLLLRKANQTKHALTQRDSVPISFAHQGQRIRPELNRDQFQRLTEDLLERTLMTVGLVLDEAQMNWVDLTRLILVGGSTRMPMIREELSRLTSLELDRSLSPDEAVAHGAAIYAGIQLGQGCETFSGVSITNVNSHDLGVLAKEPKTGEPRRQIMIKRNTPLPASQRIRFRTHEDNQQNVKVQVVEGGDDKGRNATKIGKCLVESLPPDTPKGTFVDVQFDYAQDGRLTVSASLPTLRCNAEMTMNRAAGMSEALLETWRERIEKGISEESMEQVLELAGDEKVVQASDSSGEIPMDVDQAPESKSPAKSDNATPDIAVPRIDVPDAKPDASSGFPEIRLHGKREAGKRDAGKPRRAKPRGAKAGKRQTEAPTIDIGSSSATIDSTDVPDFTAVETMLPAAENKFPAFEITPDAAANSLNAKPNGSKSKSAETQAPRVNDAAGVTIDETTAERPTPKHAKANAPKKRLTRKPMKVHAPSRPKETTEIDGAGAGAEAKQSKKASKSGKGNRASSELPPPKRVKKLAKEEVELPAGLADLATASKAPSPSESVPDFTTLVGNEQRAQVDFPAINVDDDKPVSVGGSELDDFFSNQDAAASTANGVGSAPAINVQATDSPRKLRRAASRKSKPADSDSGSDWKRRGKRLSSGDQEFEG